MRHLQRRVSHREGDEFLPVLGAGETARSRRAACKAEFAGKRREQAEDGESRGPGANLLERAFGYADGVVVHAEDEGRDRVDVAFRQALEHRGVFAGLVEAFVHVCQVGGIDGFHADEDPLAARSGDEVD